MTLPPDVPPLLRKLWHQRALLLASNIATDGREHREIAHAATLIRQDYQDRFLIELIQNANDQALIGGALDSTVLIIRSQNLLAVSNDGQVVTSRNLNRISSLADSDKTGLVVGNKGVGFKAVYQITDTPEIYSAEESTPQSSASNLFESFGVGIALERSPFNDQTLANAVEADVRTFFAQNEGLARDIAERGIANPVKAVRAEFARVAGFKFPLPRGRDQLTQRVAALDIPDSLRPNIRTLVVLPVRDDKANKDVERAIDYLIGDYHQDVEPAALAILFLRGIGRLTILDRVRERTWTVFRPTLGTSNGVREAQVTVVGPDGKKVARCFWTLQRDALTGPGPLVEERRSIIEKALRDFDLEGWKPDDPLPVTVALPMPQRKEPSPLGSPGRFCLGLPTQQSTGLPAHVDARFFATISRTALDFALPYNALLLDVATDLFGELVGHLQESSDLVERRAATLALDKSLGALADRVYKSGGYADGDVVLSWGGETFVPRSTTALPSPEERSLLPFIESALVDRPGLLKCLPDVGLLMNAAMVLESIGLLDTLGDPHPWLDRTQDSDSVIESAARKHRLDGPKFWENFASGLLNCFESTDLEPLSWLPVGTQDLAAPTQGVFFPASADTHGDEEEVENVPTKVAAMLRLLDGETMRLRVDGRALTDLALRLDKARLVRRPRKTELLEKVLFPALESAIAQEPDLALDFFGQAMQWIASMRPASRQKLDCKQARVPIVSISGIAWADPVRTYLGQGWNVGDQQDQLLGLSYPGLRLVPFATMRDRFGLSDADAALWRIAVEVLGVSAIPRVVQYSKRTPPLKSSSQRLYVNGTPTLGNASLDPIYLAYVKYLTRYRTTWDREFLHDVDEVSWLEGLEDSLRRQHILDLVLAHADHFSRNTTTWLRRVDDKDLGTVPQFWLFALSALDWPIYPGERGVGGEPVRCPPSQLWRLPEGARRPLHAQLLTVVPHALAGAGTLLGLLGVPSIENAPLARLFAALSDLARRLDSEHLYTRREALSLANELYGQIDDRLRVEGLPKAPSGTLLPLLRDRRLHAVNPNGEDVRIVFDDEPTRGRHVIGIQGGFGVPFVRDADVARIHALFVRTWGVERVLLTSTAKIALQFTAQVTGWAEVPFLDWLRGTFPHVEVAAELAALLTFGGERTLRSDRIHQNWEAFENLILVFGSFGAPDISSFYDKPKNRLCLSNGLPSPDVLASTWELAGVRSRELWAGYAQALRNGNTSGFLREHEVNDVELAEVADAAGLHRPMNLETLSPALLAARCHLAPGTTLDEAATWLAKIGDRAADVAIGLGRPDLEPVLTAAISLRPPEGELQVLGQLGVPWALWQDAVLRRDGRRYTFFKTIERYRNVRDHLVAVSRELGARDPAFALDALGTLLSGFMETPIPDDIQYLPIDAAAPDAAAWTAVRAALSGLDPITRALDSLSSPPWGVDLPIPKDATNRGVRLFREVATAAREIEASTSVKAVIQIAYQLAPMYGEQVETGTILTDPILDQRIRGEWAHVYAALIVVRELLETDAPETVKRLSSVQAFRDPATLSSLLAKLPDVPRVDTTIVEPKQTVLGVDLTETELREDLLAGASGALGQKLVLAATAELDPAILTGVRAPLAPVPSSGGGGGRGRGGRRSREPEMVGDIGEAFVHQWLTKYLGSYYSPDCWVSEARERYGFPPSGSDNFGYDFNIPNPDGRLFGQTSSKFFVEVKSTSTAGTGPFQMSHPEWEEARRCHETGSDAVYVILRVLNAIESPRIGDILIDPFGAMRRGEVRLAGRDFWVTVSPPVLGSS